jgi:hypothetical protein
MADRSTSLGLAVDELDGVLTGSCLSAWLSPWLSLDMGHIVADIDSGTNTDVDVVVGVIAVGVGVTVARVAILSETPGKV